MSAMIPRFSRVSFRLSRSTSIDRIMATLDLQQTLGLTRSGEDRSDGVTRQNRVSLCKDRQEWKDLSDDFMSSKSK
jgi:hypothetical protein